MKTTMVLMILSTIVHVNTAEISSATESDAAETSEEQKRTATESTEPIVEITGHLRSFDEKVIRLELPDKRRITLERQSVTGSPLRVGQTLTITIPISKFPRAFKNIGKF